VGKGETPAVNYATTIGKGENTCRDLVCAMNYATTMTRLGCSCSQSMLGSKLSRWSHRDLIAAVNELWYLHGTKDRGVVYPKPRPTWSEHRVVEWGFRFGFSRVAQSAHMLRCWNQRCCTFGEEQAAWVARRDDASLRHRSTPECMALGSSMC
jgi:hypothetical protein